MIHDSILVTFLAVTGHILSVIAALHIRSDMAPIMLHLLSAIIWHLLQFFVLIVMGAGIYYWHSASIFAFGVMAFVFIFSAAYKSISLRTIILLADSENASISISEITERLVKISFLDRVSMLVRTGLVTQNPTGYSLTTRGRNTTRRIKLLQKFFGARSSGLYFLATENVKAQNSSAPKNPTRI
jgi:hypothetical protein